MKQTQKFLNYFLNESLTVDGIQGAKTTEAIQRAIQKLKQKFELHSLNWNESFNFIGIRTDNDFDNTFDDFFVVFAYNTIIAFSSSTVAGLPSAVKNASLVVEGIKGVGIICENQQIDYLFVNPKDTTFWNPNWTGGIGFLYQDHECYIYRDSNGNGLIDREVKTKGLYGMNIHSWNGFYGENVDNLSEGCQVTQYYNWVNLYPLLLKNAKKNRIIYTLLQW